MSKIHALCRVDEISEGAARGFLIGEGAGRIDVVVVCWSGVLRGYVNSCPHQAMPLDTFPDKFLNGDGSLLICSTHGARFRVEDGTCVSGPCVGKALAAIDVEVMDGTVRVRL